MKTFASLIYIFAFSGCASLEDTHTAEQYENTHEETYGVSYKLHEFKPAE